jgi:hypothetical protein
MRGQGTKSGHPRPVSQPGENVAGAGIGAARIPEDVLAGLTARPVSVRWGRNLCLGSAPPSSQWRRALPQTKRFHLEKLWVPQRDSSRIHRGQGQ